MCGSFGRTKVYSSRYVRPGGGFVPNFQLFEKGDVNGEKEQKFYTFLKVRLGSLEEPPPSGLGPSSCTSVPGYVLALV